MRKQVYLTLNIILIFILAFSTEILSQNILANPTRPSASDNAFLTEYGYTEIEFGYAGQTNYSSLPLLLKFSALKTLELGFAMSGLVNSTYIGNKTETKVGDPSFQLKFQLLKNENIGLAVLGRSDFISGGTKFTFYGVPSFITSFGQIDATAGITSLNNSTSFIYALAFSPNVNLPFGFYLELFGESVENYSPLYFDAGVSYPISSDFVLDAALTRGLNDEATDWQYQIGFTKTLFRLF